VAYALDAAGPSGRDSHCRASPVAHDLHPLHPAMPARPDARQLAALLRALERADVGADRPVADRLVPPLATLAPPAEVIDKRAYSPFSEPQLSDLLRRRRGDSLLITGAETDVCVLAPVLDAADLGYRVVLATDALCSSSDATHDALLALYRNRFSQQIETASSETILACWD
jgi:nicotinamidase-related amidase